MDNLTSFQVIIGIVIVIALIIIVCAIIFIDEAVAVILLTLATALFILIPLGLNSLQQNIVDEGSYNERTQETETDMMIVPIGMGGVSVIPYNHPKRVSSNEIKNKIHSYLDSTESYKKEDKEDELRIINDIMKTNNRHLNFSL